MCSTREWANRSKNQFSARDFKLRHAYPRSKNNLKGTSAVGASWRYVALNNANITDFTRQGKRNI